MAVEITHTAEMGTFTAGSAMHPPLAALRWGAVFAGLAVGIAVNLFMLLLGAAAGLAVFAMGPGGATVAVAAWNALSMIVAAFAGAYVAARAANLRRAADGMLHGIVAWGMSMLISAFFVSSVAGAALSTLFSPVADEEYVASTGGAVGIVGMIDAGKRQEAIDLMRDRLGLTDEQAGRLVDQALVLSGRGDSASTQGQGEARRTVRSVSVASGWLSGAILLSLFAGIGGGWLGAHGIRRRDQRQPQL